MANSKASGGSPGKAPAGEQLVLVSNIPRELRSADLRFFFNEWVEGDRFRCFHYQHRADASSRGRGEQRCCLVRLKDKDVGAFTSKYHGQRWLRARPVCAPCAALRAP